jgi:hypothetical protein
MVTSSARTVERYLAELPAPRRAALEVVRSVILENLPVGFDEGMEYGMISYYVPLERYPDTYNGQALCIAGLASQKNHMAVYLMSVYGHAETRRWFQAAYRASGKKLDMGKSCLRFRSLDDLALSVVGEAIRRVSVDAYIAEYEKSRRGQRPAARKATGTRAKPNARTNPRKATGGKRATTRASTSPRR